MTQKQIRFDEGKNIQYPDWLYNYAALATPDVNSFDAINDNHIKHFHERGYLVVEDAFSADDIQSALDGLYHLMVNDVQGFDGIYYESGLHNQIDKMPLDKRQDAIRKYFYFVEYDKRLKALSNHPKLIRSVQQIIGEDDLIMFQDMALIKPPRIGREKPWHQDMAYFNLPLETTVVGAWIALDDATVDNGCMMVIPGSHEKGAVIHFQQRDWQICDTDVLNDGAVAIPLKAGSCLLFHGLIHHGTPANRSEHRRRALQFHYHATSVEYLTEDHRLEAFGSEGKDVAC